MRTIWTIINRYLSFSLDPVDNFFVFAILVRNRSDVDNQQIEFKPDMAHQIFGDTESIFGYKDLQIDVFYSAGSLDIFYDVKYGKKVNLKNKIKFNVKLINPFSLD